MKTFSLENIWTLDHERGYEFNGLTDSYIMECLENGEVFTTSNRRYCADLPFLIETH